MAKIDYILMNIIVCMIYISLYGFIRAFVSYKLGDSSSEVKKRISLSPKLHIDSVGFLFMLFFNVGFIKPMRNQVINLKNKKGFIVVTSILPGLLMFLLASIIMLIVICFCDVVKIHQNLGHLHNIGFIVSYRGNVIPVILIQGILKFMRLGVGVFLYNLIPIYPLEGEKIFNYNVSLNFRLKWGEFTSILQMALIFITVVNILPRILNEISNYYISIFI